MPTFRDLEASLLHTRELLRPSLKLHSTFTSPAADERRELLTLSFRLATRLSEVATLLSHANAETPIEQPFTSLFTRLGYFRAALEQDEYAPFWKHEIRDLIQTSGRVLRDLSESSSGKGAAIPQISVPQREPPGDHDRHYHEPTLHTAQTGSRRPARYANAVLFERESDRRLDREMAIPPGKVFRLRLDIGELSRESQVENPDAFPEHALPDADVWIDVMVSSTHFALGESGTITGRSRVAHGRFMLPRDGGPARAPDGGRYLLFGLRAPETPFPGARARVGYYFRGAIVQSQVLVADVGNSRGGFRISTDFTIAENPADLGAIRERPRVSLFTNSDVTGTHQVSIRVQGSDDTPSGTGFELDKETVGGLVSDMRAVLRREDIAPRTRKRPRARLIADMRALAPHGWNLWAAVPAQFLDAWELLDKDPEHVVLQVARSRGSSFTFPWTFIYEFPLDSGISPERLTVCPLVDRWDGRSPLFQGSPRECPEAAHVPHENILCPFGFWGFRYNLEQITSSDRPVPEIEVSPSAEVVVAETQYGVDAQLLTAHVNQLGAVLRAAFPGLTLKKGSDKNTLRKLLGTDLPIVYFFCHGERTNAADPNTYLGIGNREQLTAPDFIGWIKHWRRRGKKIWNCVRPLVFINACHSLEINPNTLVSYLDAFVGTARAAGVIGTEVKVSQSLAMDFAISFFQYFTQDGCSVDRALRQARLDFLRDGNLFGLLYTPYCWADLTLRKKS